jgi:hypothetical protein
MHLRKTHGKGGAGDARPPCSQIRPQTYLQKHLPIDGLTKATRQHKRGSRNVWVNSSTSQFNLEQEETSLPIDG